MNPTTHSLTGALLAALFFPSEPAFLVAGFSGGFFPDLDIFFGVHRRTLHWPWIYSLAGVTSLFLGLWNPFFSLAGIFLVSASLHTLLDVLSGAELRCWEPNEHGERAVYDHVRSEWLRPRRLIYAPSPVEFTIATATAALLIAVTGLQWVNYVAVSFLSTSLIYLVSVRYLDLVPPEYTEINQFVRDKTPGL